MAPREERKSVVIARETRALSRLGRRSISWSKTFAVLLGFCAFALDHHSTMAQGVHEDSPSSGQQVMSQSWSVQQGAPQNISAMAQTADGFLWLGSQGGLFRFDGTRFERFRPFLGDRLLSSDVCTLFAPPSGGLWVGYLFGGFSFVNNGHVTNYGGTVALTTGTVYTLARDSKGTMWAGTGRGVWRFDGSQWQKLGIEWDAPMVISNVGIDRTDTVWVIAGFPNQEKLLYLLPGSRRFQVANPKLNASRFTLDADQKVLTSPIALQRTPNRQTIPHNELPVYPLFGQNGAQIVDRTDAVWTVSESRGLTRIGAALPANDAVTETGAKSRETYGMATWREDLHGTLVDREGNIWYADRNGLHRFFYIPFFEQELPAKGNAAIAADDDGAVWVGFFMGQSAISNELYRVTRGQVETIRFRNPVNWGAAYRANDKTIWLGGSGGLWHLVRGKPLQVALPKELAEHAFYLQAITENRAGGLWISFIRYGLYRFADGVWTSYGQRNGLPGAGPYTEFTDSLGRVWFGYSGFWNNRLAVFDGDKVRTFSSSDGVPVGNVTAISGRGSDVWIGSEFGLDKFDGERFHAIHAVDDDWLLGISGIVERANGDLWLNGVSGIFHISQSEIAEALKDPSYRVKGEHLGARDGLPGIAAQMRPLNTAIEGSDGRLWFSETSGLVWLDPNRARDQASAPPIAIQSVSADDKTYAADLSPTLPAHTSSVGISYSAISLSNPEAVRSRVRLHETDTDWHEVTTTGPVVYRNLPPGHYHFSVEASDTDGVWSGKVANVDFTILPAWYQTAWFYIFCAVAFLAMLWAVYQLRLRQVRLQFAAGLEQRVNERTRIARELHDTLLQSFQGAVFQFQAARKSLLRNADNAMVVVDEAIHAAEEGIAEGRAAIRDLRPEPAAQRNLSELLDAAGRELATAHELNGEAPSYRVLVEGEQQEISPMLQDEVYRVIREVIRNAFAHAAASRIEVEIRYDQDQLRLRVRDDGKGIDPKILASGQSGHFGIPGMRERAQRIGAHLNFWSEMGAGAEVELTVPASIAYQKRRNGRRFWLLRRAG
jgi:signal transduction histidine kinase/ligand-binding sensor domain-containing protein